MADISIRKLDDGVAAKLSQLAGKKGISREEFCRRYLESLAALDGLKELDLKYQGLVKEMGTVIDNNTQELHNIYMLLDQLKNNLI